MVEVGSQSTVTFAVTDERSSAPVSKFSRQWQHLEFLAITAIDLEVDRARTSAKMLLTETADDRKEKEKDRALHVPMRTSKEVGLGGSPNVDASVSTIDTAC
jgi:hypothetical protein